jgi:hypothetical protein
MFGFTPGITFARLQTALMVRSSNDAPFRVVLLRLTSVLEKVAMFVLEFPFVVYGSLMLIAGTQSIYKRLSANKRARLPAAFRLRWLCELASHAAISTSAPLHTQFGRRNFNNLGVFVRRERGVGLKGTGLRLSPFA